MGEGAIIFGHSLTGEGSYAYVCRSICFLWYSACISCVVPCWRVFRVSYGVVRLHGKMRLGLLVATGWP